jgi:hypothetical protein
MDTCRIHRRKINEELLERDIRNALVTLLRSGIPFGTCREIEIAIKNSNKHSHVILSKVFISGYSNIEVKYRVSKGGLSYPNISVLIAAKAALRLL